MPYSPPNVPFRTLAVATAAALAFGCQRGPLPATVPQSAVSSAAAPGARGVPAGSSLVHINLAGFRRRHLEDNSSLAPLTAVQLRITVTGAGISPALVQTLPLVGGQAPADATLVVPLGLNRVFTVELLDNASRTINVLHGLASTPTATTPSVAVNPGTDAAARVLLDLIAANSIATLPVSQIGNLSTANYALLDLSIQTALATTDSTAGLLAFTNAACGYDTTANTFTNYSPLLFNDAALASTLQSAGPTFLTSTPSAAPFDIAGAGTVNVTVTDGSNVVQNAVDVFVLSPNFAASSPTDSSGFVAITDVPPGTWTVFAHNTNGTAGFAPLPGTVTVTAGQATPVTVVVSAIALAPVPVVAPTSDSLGAPAAFPAANSHPFVDTLAAGQRDGQGVPAGLDFVHTFIPSVGIPQPFAANRPTKLAYDSSGNLYILAFDQVLEQTTSGLVRRFWLELRRF